VKRLAGKVAIVTGGSRGIGLATAYALLQEGATVAITATSDATLRAGAEELEKVAAATVVAIRADVRDEDDVRRAIDTVAGQLGGVDALVNNAGVGVFRPVEDTTTDDWRRVIDTNLTGVFFSCRAILPHLRSRGGGWIVNVSSLSGINPFAGGAAYCASKAALDAFSEALMQEVRHDGIRVACVAPGSVNTDFTGRSTHEAGAAPGSGSKDDWKLSPGDVAAVIVDLMAHPSRSLPSRVELRPSRPPKK
jgi:NAD(P)-dependent dehydrogenase (short-subunit alcohol dehydrogenase family)